MLAIAVVAASCSGSPAPALDPGPLLTTGIAAMRAVESAHFEMTRTGAPVTLAGLPFDSAVGRYAAPDSAEAVLSMRAGDLAVEMGTISLADRTWLTNPVTGLWEELTPGTGFNPAVLFDPASGWAALLEDLDDVSFVATKDGRHHLAATAPAVRVETLTADLVVGQSVPIDLWFDAETGHIVRLEFTTAGDDGASDWVITLSRFGESVLIEPPPAG